MLKAHLSKAGCETEACQSCAKFAEANGDQRSSCAWIASTRVPPPARIFQETILISDQSPWIASCFQLGVQGWVTGQMAVVGRQPSTFSAAAFVQR